jgi:hypothetical protein
MSASGLDDRVARLRKAVENFLRDLDRISPPPQTITEPPVCGLPFELLLDIPAYLPCTEAIPIWLAAAGGTHDIKEVWDGLIAAGRSDRLDTVSMTLAELASKGKIIRVSRGRYMAA